MYRLQGDGHSIHIDPVVCKKIGFQGPILHGLCTHSIVARVIVENLLENDDTRLKSILVRFKKPLYPGELLVIKFWKKDGGVIFEVTVKARKIVIMIGESNF